MVKTCALFLLFILAVPAKATDEEIGSEYRNWCARRVDGDGVAATERDSYIRKCMTTLAEADRNPDRIKRKRKENGDDDG